MLLRTDFNREITRYVDIVLPKKYRRLNFENHCYRRIAYDNVLECKWKDKYSTFSKEASLEELENVLIHLHKYFANKNVLLRHNVQSIKYRSEKI